MIQQFIDSLQAITPISASLTKHFETVVHVQKLKQGHVLLSEGQIADRLFFINSGLVRAYCVEKNDEITTIFATDNEFIYATHSFIRGEASYETIVLLEDSVILSVYKKDLEQLYQDFPETVYISLKITEQYLALYDQRIRSLRWSSAERLKHFEQLYPNLLPRVQVQHLATYLGLSRSQLSSLRAKR